MPRHRPPGAFRRHVEARDIDTGSDAILYALIVEAPLHLYHLAILIAALAGSLILQCLILVWITLYLLQVRIFLLSARVLQESFAETSRLAVVDSSDAPNASLKEDISKAGFVQEEVVKPKIVKPPFELPATPVDSRTKVFLPKVAAAQPSPTKALVAGVAQLTRTLDKLRDAARATDRRTLLRDLSPVSDLEEQEVKPATPAPPQASDGDMIDWGAMTARETDADREMLRLTLNHDNDTTSSQGHDGQHKDQWTTENHPPPRPVLRLPNDRPPRPQPAIANIHPNVIIKPAAVQAPPSQATCGARQPRPQPAVTSSYPNTTNAQAAVQASPPQAPYGTGQTLNRSSGFTSEQLAAAKEFMSTATRKGGSKPSITPSRPRQASASQLPVATPKGRKKFGNAAISQQHTAPAQLVVSLHKDRERLRQQQVQEQIRVGKAFVKVGSKALAEVGSTPTKSVPVQRPPGWIAPHLAAKAAKAACVAAIFQEDKLKEVFQDNASHGGAETKSDWEDVQTDRSKSPEPPVEDNQPTWEDSSAVNTHVEAPCDTANADHQEAKVGESLPSAAVLSALFPDVAVKENANLEVDIAHSKEPRLANTHGKHLLPVEHEQATTASPDRDADIYVAPTGCTPARLRLFAGRDDAGDAACTMCTRTRVASQDAVCFPCSTVAGHVDEIKELLAPYGGKFFERQEASWRRVAQDRRPHTAASKYGKSWTSMDVDEESVNQGFESTLFTIVEPETLFDKSQPLIQDSTYEYPDLLDLTSDFSDKVPTVKLSDQARTPVKSRKLSANALLFLAPPDHDLENAKPASTTDRTLSPIEHSAATSDVEAAEPTSPEFCFEPRPGSSLSDSRWAPKNAVGYGQQPPIPGFSPTSRKTQNLDAFFGSPLVGFGTSFTRAQSDPAQLSLANYHPISQQVLPREHVGTGGQVEYMSPTATSPDHPMFALQEQQALPTGTMRLPPGLPVPEHLKKSLRLSKAISITKPVRTSEGVADQVHGPSLALAAPEPVVSHHATAIDSSMPGLLDVSGIEDKVEEAARTASERPDWTDKKMRDLQLTLQRTTGSLSKPNGETKPSATELDDSLVKAIDPECHSTENVPPFRSHGVTTDVNAGDSKKTNSTTITKPTRLRKIAREVIIDAYRARDQVRVQLLGSWNLEKAKEYEAATELYNNKRNELAALSLNGKLNDEDARSFPELSGAHMSGPKVPVFCLCLLLVQY